MVRGGTSTVPTVRGSMTRTRGARGATAGGTRWYEYGTYRSRGGAACNFLPNELRVSLATTVLVLYTVGRYEVVRVRYLPFAGR